MIIITLQSVPAWRVQTTAQVHTHCWQKPSSPSSTLSSTMREAWKSRVKRPIFRITHVNAIYQHVALRSVATAGPAAAAPSGKLTGDCRHSCRCMPDSSPHRHLHGLSQATGYSCPGATTLATSTMNRHLLKRTSLRPNPDV